jgi:ABC-type transport system involved in multi-copper enzyme maturation permease subunit
MDKLRRIWIIASNTFRESVRDKILYNIVFVAVALSIFSIVLGEWSVFDRAHVIKAITLSLMSLSGLLISVFVGISLVQKEIQGRTVLTLLSKPLHRAEFIIGKYLGLLGVMGTHLTLLTGVFFVILWGTGSQPEFLLLKAVYLIFWEMAIVIAVAMLFSSFSTPVLSSLFTLGVYAAGHLTDQLLAQVRFVKQVVASEVVQQNSQLMEFMAVWAHRLLPGLYRYNISQQVIHHLPIPELYFFWSTLYAIGYVGILLSVASWWFGRRDFL